MNCLWGEVKKDPHSLLAQVSGDSKEDILGQVIYYFNKAFAEDNKTVLHGQLKEPLPCIPQYFHHMPSFTFQHPPSKLASRSL